jgi:hypothetical protein
VSRLFPERRTLWLAPATGGVEALRATEFKQPCKVTVVLSNHFVRYALVPWSDALAGAAEEDAYVRHHFAKIHGERAKSWVLRSSEGPRGAPRLASAIDKDLLGEIKACFPAKGRARLVSVQPALMAGFNGVCGKFPAAGAWLVFADAERACVALHARGRWLAVQNARGSWQELLERERHRSAEDVQEVLHVQ